jgi:two-component system, cell cycle sensor histidine kinase and response regulator CckA
MQSLNPDSELPAPPESPEWLAALNRAILDSALDCIITMDARGVVREFNPAAERVFGYTRAEAVGRELAELIVPPQLRDRHRQGLAHYLRTGEGPVLGRRIEIAGVRRDGAEILVELAITAFRIGDEPVFTAYLRDITERVQTERRRIAQYNVASVLAASMSIDEAAPQVIQTIAASGPWVFGSIWLRNEAGDLLQCAATWHGDAEELAHFAKVTRDTEIRPPLGLPGRAVQSRQPTWVRDVTDDENFIRRSAAAAAELRGAFAFPLSADGEVNAVLELFSREPAEPDEDLLQMVEALGSQLGLFIHRHKIEQELQRQKEAAEAANAAKDRFLATLSHELRTPLTPVLIWAGGTIDQPGLPEEIRDGLRMVVRNVELEARLIDDLLDLTRIARGKLQLNVRAADIHELLRHALAMVQSEIDERQLTVDLRLAATQHQLLVDPSRMQQVFWNLLRNAAKFTPSGGSVAVRTFNRAPGQLTIEVSDTGVGIEPQFLEKIFDAFEQVGLRREGLGLGLAISKAVVEMHGGTIRAMSSGRGTGATFVVELA